MKISRTDINTHTFFNNIEMIKGFVLGGGLARPLSRLVLASSSDQARKARRKGKTKKAFS